ncbi:hypothetical protein ANCDUO_01485 [Ancylostoma duodenale]|uniref:Uncharacterized protein n=1 Tax=Ancylostoma duodenale TaxID=51022 RepID=A0A0C2DE21_9BILA|nr:hypothetical protein ANCDUO_01485 [Ancylostoma duodenale]
MYADDIKIYAAYNDLNEEEIHSALLEAVHKMMDWARNSPAYDYNLNGVGLQRKDIVKDLDVKVETQPHIENFELRPAH